MHPTQTLSCAAPRWPPETQGLLWHTGQPGRRSPILTFDLCSQSVSRFPVAVAPIFCLGANLASGDQGRVRTNYAGRCLTSSRPWGARTAVVAVH